jgi:hypothetical protein
VIRRDLPAASDEKSGAPRECARIFTVRHLKNQKKYYYGKYKVSGLKRV